MIKSMTGYARASRTLPCGRVSLELHCVNKRALEISVNLPRGYLCYDLLLRELLRKEISRGQVTVRLFLERAEGEQVSVPTLLQFKALKKEWDARAQGLGMDPKKEVSLAFLVGQLSDEAGQELSENEVKSVVKAALKELDAMREKEGLALKNDLLSSLQVLEMGLATVEKGAGVATQRYEEHLKEKIVHLSSGDFDEKLAREVAIFADKADVNEEIVRLKSHFEQVRISLEASGTAMGRTLEFLMQEMHRELNTLGSKIADGALVHKVVQMKNELGKMREQVQNVE